MKYPRGTIQGFAGGQHRPLAVAPFQNSICIYHSTTSQNHKAAMTKKKLEGERKAEYPPFMFGYGILPAIFAKIQDQEVPDIFSHDYLRYTLGFSRESDRAFIPLARRIGLLMSNGKPADLYHEMRKPRQLPAVLANALHNGYPSLYARNAIAHELERKSLIPLVAEVTGLDVGHATARAIVGTFLTLKILAYPQPPVERVANRRKTSERRYT